MPGLLATTITLVPLQTSAIDNLFVLLPYTMLLPMKMLNGAQNGKPISALK